VARSLRSLIRDTNMNVVGEHQIDNCVDQRGSPEWNDARRRSSGYVKWTKMFVASEEIDKDVQAEERNF